MLRLVPSSVLSSALLELCKARCRRSRSTAKPRVIPGGAYSESLADISAPPPADKLTPHFGAFRASEGPTLCLLPNPATMTPTPLLPDTAPHTTADLQYYDPPANGPSSPPPPSTPLTLLPGEIPYDRLYPSPLPDTNVIPRTYNTPIYDLRPLVDAGREGETSVDVTGFQVVPAREGKTVMRGEDWASEDKIREVYYPEVERCVFGAIAGKGADALGWEGC